MELLLLLLFTYWIARFFFRTICNFVIWLYNSILGGFSRATEIKIRYATSQIIRWIRFVIAILIIICIVAIFL